MQLFLVKALGFQAFTVDARCVGHGARTHRVRDNIVNLVFVVTEILQRQWNRLVDDLEVTTARKLLELHQCEVWLNARGVTVHHQTDGPRRRNHSGLSVAVTVLFATFECAIPRGLGRLDQGWNGTVLRDQRHRQNGQAFIAIRLTIGSATVVANHAQHGIGVLGIAGEGTALRRNFSRRFVGDTGHKRRKTATNGATFVRVVAKTHRHQQRANVCEAQTQRPVFVRQLGDFLGRELSHQNRRFERQSPKTTSMLVTFDVQRPCCIADELHQVQRGKVTRSVIKEHVFGARVRRIDAA